MTLDELEMRAASLREHVAAPIEFPEPAIKLDLLSREGEPVRQFKYLHQMCLLHAENFVRANEIKLVTLLDGYQLVARAQNALGPYLYARTLLELCAFSYDVAARLRDIAAKPSANWRPKGEEFFALLVRARFATTDPAKRQFLEAAGCPSRLLKPLNVMSSLSALAADPQAGTLSGQYEKFCDFVHHNLSSQVTSSPGFRMGDSAHSAGGGALVTTKQGPITRYEYPVSSKAARAVEETLPVIVKAVEICVKSLKTLPRTPFSPEMPT